MRKWSTQVTLGDALYGYLGRVDTHGNLARTRVADIWADAVGPEIAKHTSDIYLRESELVVYVDSPVWATELTALSARLAENVNARLGQELVGSMRFTVSRKVSEQREREARTEADADFYEEDEVEVEPLDQGEVEQVRQSASAIRSPELREAVIRATVKDLEWKRALAKRDSERGA